MLRIRLYFLRYIFCFYLGTVHTMERWSGRFLTAGPVQALLGIQSYSSG